MLSKVHLAYSLNQIFFFKCDILTLNKQMFCYHHTHIQHTDRSTVYFDALELSSVYSKHSITVYYSLKLGSWQILYC